MLSDESCVSEVQEKREDFLSLVTSHLLRAPFFGPNVYANTGVCANVWLGRVVEVVVRGRCVSGRREQQVQSLRKCWWWVCTSWAASTGPWSSSFRRRCPLAWWCCPCRRLWAEPRCARSAWSGWCRPALDTGSLHGTKRGEGSEPASRCVDWQTKWFILICTKQTNLPSNAFYY